MKRAIFSSMFIITLALTSGYGEGRSVVKETRNLTNFTKVSFGVAGNLYISIGKEFSVVLEGDESYLRDILTDVSGGRLVIKKDSWRQNFNEKVTVNITMPAIEALGVSGSGRAEITNAVMGDNLNLSVSGSGKLYTADLNVNDMKCSISGSGDIILGGNSSVNNGDISISGSGNYTGESTSIKSLGISISGSGSCTCNVTESLKASVSGSGNVTYMGNPKVDVRVSGSGKVRSK